MSEERASDDGTNTEEEANTDGGTDDPPEAPRMGDLLEELQELEDTVDSPEEREQVRETMRMAMDVQQSSVFGRIVKGFGIRDLAQAFMGSLVFGIPMFVEGGTNEVGEFIAGSFVAGVPVYLLATHVFVLGLVIGILYVADIQDVRIYNPILGIVPRRLVGVLGISLVTATVVMTMWGRIAWSDPLLAFSQVSVAYVPMSLGAALGDIIPD
jgi:uncharacterized membrane protein